MIQQPGGLGITIDPKNLSVSEMRHGLLYGILQVGDVALDGTKIEAGVIKRPELETMQFFVKGVVVPFPIK